MYLCKHHHWKRAAQDTISKTHVHGNTIHTDSGILYPINHVHYESIHQPLNFLGRHPIVGGGKETTIEACCAI